ncbi:MAG: hypothetical protein AAF621_07410, partial [Pseudomonadota bacterium]
QDQATEKSTTKSEKLIKILRLLTRLKKKGKKSYSDLVDIIVPEKAEAAENTRTIAIAYRSKMDCLELITRAQNIITEYSEMKDFILDVFVPFAAGGMTALPSKDTEQKIQKEAVNRIKSEIDQNFKDLTVMTASLVHKQGTELHKSVTYNDLRDLVTDLECRITQYRPYYQSYVVDNCYASEDNTVHTS